MKQAAVPLQLTGLLADGQFHSGEELDQQLAMSRAAINKHIQTLQQWGLEITSVPGKGYALASPLQLLDEQIILQGLANQPGVLAVIPVLDSTNQYLQDRLPGLQSGDGCVAEYQSAGRGRRGRSWFSPFGSNLYLSLFWQLEQGPAAAVGLSLAIGVTLAKVLQQQCAADVRVKWPNDIYLHDRKLAGILVELKGNINDAAQLVIGVGINLSMRQAAAEAIDQPWISLNEAGILCDRNQLVILLVTALRKSLLRFEREGLAPFLPTWAAFDQYRDQPVYLLLGEQRIEGIARGIDAQGALLLERDGQINRFVGGEVSLRGKITSST